MKAAQDLLKATITTLTGQSRLSATKHKTEGQKNRKHAATEAATGEKFTDAVGFLSIVIHCKDV